MNSGNRATALELIQRPDIESNYIVEGVVPIGLTILAGQQKAGKSTIATQLGLDTGSGNSFLDNFNTQKSKVIFLSLEEADELTTNRLKRICNPFESLQNVEYYFKFESLDEGGLEKVEWYIEQSPDVGLVIIDTLANFIGDRLKGTHGYSNESSIARRFHKIAKVYGVAIIAIHHTTKNITGSINDIRGFGGYTATADNVLMLTSDKTRGIGKLQRIGRYGDADYALKYNQERHCWDYLGIFDDTVLTQERLDILEVLIDACGPLMVKRIAKEVKKSPSATSNLLKRLVIQGYVCKPTFRTCELTPAGRRVLAAQL